MSKTVERLAYSVAQFADAVGLSESAIRDEIRDGRLIPTFYNSKQLITKAEGARWLATLPDEKPEKTS